MENTYIGRLEVVNVCNLKGEVGLVNANSTFKLCNGGQTSTKGGACGGVDNVEGDAGRPTRAAIVVNQQLSIAFRPVQQIRRSKGSLLWAWRMKTKQSTY